MDCKIMATKPESKMIFRIVNSGEYWICANCDETLENLENYRSHRCIIDIPLPPKGEHHADEPRAVEGL